MFSDLEPAATESTKPTLSLTPKIIRGFEGETIDIRCSSIGGSPAGHALLSYGDEKMIEDVATETENTASQIDATIALSKALQGLMIVCSDQFHLDVKDESEPIDVIYAESLIKDAQILEFTEDLEVDCAKNMDTNGIAEYLWMGWVEGTQPIINIEYDPANEDDLTLYCIVHIEDDPFNREWRFDYILAPESALESRLRLDSSGALKSNQPKLATVSSTVLTMSIFSVIFSQQLLW